MIERVEIRNFQSLHHVDVPLSQFTVVLGPSSSGKSAFTRAIRLCTNNKRGLDFLTHGQKLTVVTLDTDRGSVTLKRGKSTDDNSYTVIPTEGEQRTWKKLGGETPPEVSDFLRIQGKDPINYAGQFDKPYLLDDSGGEVARVLGALTNVNIIFEAAREATRRRGQATTSLKHHQEGLERIQAKMDDFRRLKPQMAAIERAEAGLDEARELERKIFRLRNAIEAEKIASDALAATAGHASIVVPDERELLGAAAKLSRFRDLLAETSAASKAAAAKKEALDTITAEESALQVQYADAVGTISDDLAGWFAAVAETEWSGDIELVTVTEAVRVASLYIEEKSKQ